MTEDMCVDFVEKSPEPFLRVHKPGSVAKVLLLQDHLGAQQKGRYIQKLHEVNVESTYGPKNKTECWQPVDAD